MLLNRILKSAYFFNFKFSKVSVDNTCNLNERLSHKMPNVQSKHLYNRYHISILYALQEKINSVSIQILKVHIYSFDFILITLLNVK
jgi:hypothetical protein